MNKSREFNNILDECLERLLVKGETLEQCLTSFPKQADELKPLLEVALATKQASAIQPRPEFREKARHQLYATLTTVAYKRSRPVFSWGGQPRWATVTAVVLVLLLAGSGTVFAAGGSMPDQPLYPVKLATEQVQLTLTPSALGKAELYAELADRRVQEMTYMAAENKPAEIEPAARRMGNYLVNIAELASVREVKDNVAMAPQAEGAPPTFKRDMGGRERRPKLEHRARLKGTVADYAINHPARLRALLRAAPEAARPALLRAIYLSETGYKKALESFD